MPAKKKARKKQSAASSARKTTQSRRSKAKPSKTAHSNRARAKSSHAKNARARGKSKSAAQSSVSKKTAKKKTAKKKPASAARTVVLSKPPRTRREPASATPASRRIRSADTQSGDLQGLSDIERADSESVDELLEEGNSFEAGVVAGVEQADNADESEVHTHESPEDDVPEEYLDNE
jgi:hypothetical protein